MTTASVLERQFGCVPSVIYEDDTIVVEQRYAPLPHLGGRPIEYGVVVGKDQELTTSMYWNGWLDVTQSLEPRVPLAVEMAAQGVGMVIIKNDRSLPMAVDPRTSRKGAFYTHSLNSQAVITAEGWQDRPLAGHGFSAGGISAAQTITDVTEKGWTCFEESNVVLEAAAGLRLDEGRLTLASRFLGCIASDIIYKPKKAYSTETIAIMDKTDQDGYRGFFENIPRGLKEVDEIATTHTDLHRLSRMVGNLAVVVHGRDSLKPDRIINPAVYRVFESGGNITYVTPYTTDPAPGQPSGVEQGHHLDSFTNPRRTVATIAPLLRAS